jgi:hypothetical protein
MRSGHRFICAAAVAAAAAALTVNAALAQDVGGAGMPDVRQMSGIPLPVGDLAPGTVVVRVIRGNLANPVVNQSVELVGPATQVTIATNDAGRAEFTGLTPGTRVKAAATVGDERLESQEFAVPAAGGVRLMLVGLDPEAQKLAEMPPQAGEVALGNQTRFVVEGGAEGLSVFYILQIVNAQRTPVQPTQPVVFDLPDGAVGAGLLDGSSPQAAVAGRRVTINGPFAPGNTDVQFAYTVPYSAETVTIAQRLPIVLERVTILAQKVGAMQLGSPQIAQQREMSAEGQTYIVGQGPGLKAGDTMTLTFTGLPFERTWPRNVALAIASAILAAGAWVARRGGRAARQADGRRRKLAEKRDRLFGELTTLEEKNRRDLVAALERVYAEMDEEAAA